MSDLGMELSQKRTPLATLATELTAVADRITVILPWAIYSGRLPRLSLFHFATSLISVSRARMLKLFSHMTNSVMCDNGLHFRPADQMKSTSQHCHAFIKKLGFKLRLPTDFRRGSWLITKPHGPSGLPLADRVKFGAFEQGTLPVRLSWQHRYDRPEAGGVGAGSTTRETNTSTT